MRILIAIAALGAGALATGLAANPWGSGGEAAKRREAPSAAGQASPGPHSTTDWPAWRGPDLRGSSPERGLPLKWSAQENVAFRLALPSAGAATPIVSGDRIFVTAVENDAVWLWWVDRRRGAVSWKQALGPAAGHAHRKHNMGSPSPVTDGQTVFALTGSGILKGFALDGRELWKLDIQKEYGAFGLN